MGGCYPCFAIRSNRFRQILVFIELVRFYGPLEDSEIVPLGDNVVTIYFYIFCSFPQTLDFCGAGCKNRTRDLLITNQLLYQLS